MNEEHYDAVIIGGGPGGSSAGSYLARANRRAIILEKETFPRFHIGESLLPYNQKIFKDLGLLPKLEALGFPKKYGAQFHLANATKATSFVFSRGVFTKEHCAFQVERATFDKVLLDHAREQGVSVHEGWTVSSFSTSHDGVEVEARARDGQIKRLRAKFLIDASGRNNLTGNHENLKVIHPHMKRVAIFGHFLGVQTDPGPAGNDTIIVRLDNKWFWLIPIGAGKVSVGLIVDKGELGASGLTTEDFYFQTMASAKAVEQRMQSAKLVGQIQVTGDFSYYNRRFVSHRLLRVGDAAGFMDPIFSAGVYLAMYSGKLAAEAVSTALTDNNDGKQLFRRYDKHVQYAMHTYWRMVEYYYKPAFFDLFMSPTENFRLFSAVNALLAGELQGGIRLRWRLELFFLLVRIQRFFPLAPRVAYSEASS